MHTNRLRVLSPALVLAGLSSAVIAATPVVVSNTSNLLPNTAGQTIQLFIAGTDQIAGENLNVQINGGTTGPLITGIDIVDGTIFASSNTGQGQGIITNSTIPGLNNHIAVVTTTTLTGSVVDNGLLLTLTLATGASSGSIFDLNLFNTLNGPSDLVLPNASTTSFMYSHIQFSIGTADRQWNVNGGGAWENDGNWTPFAPYAPGDSADFYGALTTATTASVTLGTNDVIGSVNFNNTIGSYALIPTSATAGSLELNNQLAAPIISDSAGSHTISVPITLDASTNVTVVRAGDVVTLSGNISGAASNLNLSGSGELVLSGTNTYAATTINPGATLQVGGGLTTGSLGSGAVTDNGALVFDRSDAPTIANGISGSGALTDIGSGTLLLQGVVNIGGGVNAMAGLIDFSGGVTHTVGAVTIGSGNLQVEPGTKLLSGAVTAMSTGAWNIAGTQQIQPGLLNAGTSTVDAVPNITGIGTLDISDDKLIIEASNTTSKATEISQLQALVTQGKASGTWTGTGLTSSAVAADAAAGTNNTFHTVVAIVDNGAYPPGTGKTMFGGVPVDANSILITRALAGDANLDGTVNNTDLVALLTHFTLTGQTQATGDFNGDGTVNNTDLVALLTDYTQTLPGYFPIVPAGSGLGSSAPVPEPASLALLGLGGAALLIRRRKLPRK